MFNFPIRYTGDPAPERYAPLQVVRIILMVVCLGLKAGVVVRARIRRDNHYPSINIQTPQAIRITSTASRYNVRLNRISRRLQVRTHLLEDHSFRPINNSENVLAANPSRSNSPNNPQHFRPEVAVVLRAFALARERERLAGETACKDVNSCPRQIVKSVLCVCPNTCSALGK